jgi:hypothetical protein
MASIEWDVAEADVVFRGEIIELEELGSGEWVRAKLRVKERIKGDVADEFTYLICEGGGVLIEPGAGGRRVGQEMLACLKSLAGVGHMGGADMVPPPTGVATMVLRRGYRLTLHEGESVWGLSGDLRELTKPDEILAVARGAAAGVRGEEPEALFWPQDGVPLAKRMRVIVPVSAATEAKAVEWAKADDPGVRMNALTVLRRLGDSPQRTRVLKAMVRDPYAEASGQAKWRTRHYPIRAAANAALTVSGVSGPAPVIDEPGDVYRRVGLQDFYLAVSAGVVLIAGWLLWAARLTARRGRGLVWSGVTAISLCACALFGVMWLRGAWRVDQFLVRRGDGRAEICLGQGAVQVTHVSDWPQADAVLLGSFDAGTDLDVLWDVGASWPVDEQRRLGFMAARGSMLDLTRSATPGRYTWRAWALPYWFLVCASGLLPVSRCVMAIAHRGRVRQGLCAECGYDLRSGHARCPECGWEVPVAADPRRMAAVRVEAEREWDVYVDRLAKRLERVRE